jgi:oligopeptide/dipeptide ABC transporter ATP-binding protein
LSEPLLSIQALSVSFSHRGHRRQVLDRVDLEVFKGRTLALVGETGSGKTVAALATLRLLPTPPASYDAGRISFDGRDLLSLSEVELRGLRGTEIAMVFQEPDAALNPFATVGQLVSQPLHFHERPSRARARRIVDDVLREVGFDSPKRVLRHFPHGLPEGQRQRVLLAMALVCDPKLLILDEPTAALDLPSRARIVELLANRREERDATQVIITHDLGLVAQTADDVVVLYAGRVVERGARSELLARPVHPYTRGLLASVPPTRIMGAPHERRLPTIPGSLERDATSHGCRFRKRCAYHQTHPPQWQRCVDVAPELIELGSGRAARCHYAEELS